MSFESYAKWWIKAKQKFQDLRVWDEQLVVKTKKPKTKRKFANALVGGLYARYCLLVQELDACLDQMCQPQRRIAAHKIVDAAVIRLKQLKEEMVKIDLSEYHYIDGNLIELKIVPKDIEILHPTMFFHRHWEIEEMWEKIKNGEKIYVPPPPPEPEEGEGGEKPPEGGQEKPPEEAAKEAEAQEEEGGDKKKKRRQPPKKEVSQLVTETVELTPEEQAELEKQRIFTEAVTMIQSAERARQCRLYYSELDAIRQMRLKAGQKQGDDKKGGGKVEKTDSELDFIEDMACIIQKTWKGYAARKLMKKKELERRFLIGMCEPSFKRRPEFEKMLQTMEARRVYRDQKIKEYIQANLDEKDRVLRVIAPGLMEDIGDEIREYFYQFYIQAKGFDVFPKEEQGGSILIVRAETMTPKQWLIAEEKKKAKKGDKKDLKAQKAKEKAKRKKEKAAEKKRLKKEKEQQKKLEAEQRKREMQGEFSYKPERSPVLDQIDNTFLEYEKIWDEINYKDNPTETHYMDMITEEKCYEMQLEVRPIVDELMRIELDMLNDALELDKWRAKGKKGMPKKKKKKDKKKKKKKGKGKKDPTGKRTTEDLFQELVDNGIIHTYPSTRLEEYKGDFSYQNFEKRNADFDPPATLGDVRQAVTLNCILPLGVETMVKPKSVLIAGPPQTGKRILANAIFTATRCVLFELSPPILAGKYPGKKGMKMLMHLINKMSRILQPSIIYFDGAHKPFYKKIPEEEKELEPKKLGKKIFKEIVKPIKPEDRVMVLGITNQPFNASAAGLKKAYEKVILIPRPDYGSIYLYWRELLMPYHGVDRNFNFTALTTVTKYYPLSTIRMAVMTVMTPDRIIQLSYKPLTAAELYEAILVSETPNPISEQDYLKFTKWYDKYPTPKMRKAIMKIAEELRAAEAALAAKKNK